MSKPKMMPNMQTYGGQESPGYKPPSGNAGVKAKGLYSSASNPLSVPAKGSSIAAGHGNADRMKAMANKNAQAVNESLRGKAC